MNSSSGKLNTDREGFLKDLSEWSSSVATQLAQAEGILLTDSHWELIQLIREFYSTYKISPTMRVFVRLVRDKFGEDKGHSIHILTLFPNHPLRLLNKIAGLPKPTNCD